MPRQDIHMLTLTPDIDTIPANNKIDRLVVIRLYDSGMVSGHSTMPIPAMTVEVIRCEQDAATDILLHLHA
jgi:hypothetical protein